MDAAILLHLVMSKGLAQIVEQLSVNPVISKEPFIKKSKNLNLIFIYFVSVQLKI